MEPITLLWRILVKLVTRADISLLKRLFPTKPKDPPKRVRVCIECGMPIAEHKEWCSILKGPNEMRLRAMPLSQDQS